MNATSSTGNSTSVADTEVMQYFTLPAEYAFVGRALSQMDGVGKSLDPDFDFVSSAAPWMYEIKGAGKYLKEEIIKWMTNQVQKIEKNRNAIFGHFSTATVTSGGSHKSNNTSVELVQEQTT